MTGDETNADQTKKIIQGQLKFLQSIAFGQGRESSLSALSDALWQQYRPLCLGIFLVDDQSSLVQVTTRGPVDLWAPLCGLSVDPHAASALAELLGALPAAPRNTVVLSPAQPLFPQSASADVQAVCLQPVEDGQGRLIGALALGFTAHEAPSIPQQGYLSAYAFAASLAHERARLDAQIHRLAFYDDLTGLPNRRHFLEKLNAAIAAGDTRANGWGVLILDIDSFKEINDSAGHLVGDEVLVECGKRLQACVGQDGLAARLSGDEFVALLQAPAEGLGQAVQRLQHALQQPVWASDCVLHVTVSIGTARFKSGDTVRSLLQQADRNMYAHKRGIKWFDDPTGPA